MMTKKQLTFLAVLALAVSQAVFGQHDSPTTGPQRLTLAEAVNLAVTSQPLVRKLQSDAAAARAAVGQAESGYYPSITGSASYTRVEPNQSFTFPGLGAFSLGQEDNWDFHVGLAQVIYASGRRSASVKLAEAGAATAQIGVEQARMNVAYRTVQAFYTVLFLQRQVQSLDLQLADLEQHLSFIRKKRETGSATQYDVLSTGVRVVSMKNDLIDARNQERKQLIALKALIGLAPAAPVELVGSFSSDAGMAGVSRAAQSYLSEALADRPEIKQALNAEATVRLDLALAKLQGLPTLSAHAQAGFKNGLLPDESSLTFNWNAGVSLSVPVFDGFEVADRIKQAQAKLDSAQENSAAVRRTVTTEVLQAYQDLSARREKAKNSLLQLEQARAALDQAKVQYNVGVITNVEYLDAQSALERAQFANLSSLFHEVMSEYALKQATGQKLWN